MDRPMKKPELGRRMQQEIRGLLKLSPLMLASLVLVAMLWRTDSAANSGLFQSSPVETPAALTPTPAATIMPSVTAVTSPQPTSVAPAATSVQTEPPPTDTPVASATSETAEPEATPDESQRYPEGESNLRFEWGMLFDSAALFFSYVWLCCGILLFIAIPFLFFILWRTSTSRQEAGGQEDDGQEEGGQEED